MHIRNVHTYGHCHIYINIVRLIIEHPREWLASFADYTVDNVDPTMELLLKVLDFGSIPFHETHWWFFYFIIAP